MGIIFSRFRKEKSTYQKLEALEDKIKSIETYTIHTQQRQKRWVGGIRVFFVGFTIIAIITYILFFPPTWRNRAIGALPAIVSLFIMVLSKNLVAWHFERKVTRNSSKLGDLREEKKNLLEKVMETETYKVAVDILNRFGEKPNTRPQPPNTPTNSRSIQSGQQKMPSTVPRIMPTQGYTPIGQPLTLQNRMIQSGRMGASPGGNGGGGLNQSMINRSQFNNSPGRMNLVGSTPQRYDSMRRNNMNNNTNLNNTNNSNQLAAQFNMNQSIAVRTPFPIIDFENKGVFEKIIDRLIGDGPSDRFALICKECHKHNGMALEDEFYYSAFYCIFCNTLNAAKRLRPIAPTLPTHNLQQSSSAAGGLNSTNPNFLQRKYSSGSSSSSTSSSTGDDESGPSNSDLPAATLNPNDIANQQIKEQQKMVGFDDDVQQRTTTVATADEPPLSQSAELDEKYDSEGDQLIKELENIEQNYVNNEDDGVNFEMGTTGTGTSDEMVVVDDADDDVCKIENNDRIIEDKQPGEKKND